MPIEPARLAARRCYRLGGTVALALAIAYGSGISVPYLAPLLAFVMTVKPAPPMGFGKLAVVALVLAIILASGLVIAPLLHNVPLVAIVLVGLGLFVSAKLSLGGDRAAIGTLLAVGLTLVSAMGVLSLALAQAIVEALVVAFIIAVIAQSFIYPFFPECELQSGSADEHTVNDVSIRADNTLAWQSVAVSLPAYIFLLIDPIRHAPVMMKSISLSQTGAGETARKMGGELLLATCAGGVLAIGLWFGLKLAPTLVMFSLWTALVMTGIGRKIYCDGSSRRSVQFWTDVGVTCLILIGPAVEDSANGKDPYEGFAFRFGLFLLVSVYTWLALSLLGIWRDNTQAPIQSASNDLHRSFSE